LRRGSLLDRERIFIKILTRGKIAVGDPIEVIQKITGTRQKVMEKAENSS